jgi:hypothetical protein
MYFIFFLFQVIAILHVIKTGRFYPWFYILIFLPGIGMIAYLLFEILPDPAAFPYGVEIHEFIHRLRQPKISLEALEEQMEEIPTVQNMLAVADVYREKKKYGEAIALYQKSIAKSVADDGFIRRRLAFTYFDNGEFVHAREELEKIRKIVGAYNAEELLYYARILDTFGDKEAAAPYYQQAAHASHSLESDYYLCRFLQQMNLEKDVSIRVKKAQQKYDAMPRRSRGESKVWLKKIQREFL